MKIFIRLFNLSKDEVCLIECSIEGLPFDIEVHPVEELGFDERKKREKFLNIIANKILENLEKKRKE